MVALSPVHAEPAREVRALAARRGLGGVRDTKVHAPEHRFAIAPVAAVIEALDLEFLGFEIARAKVTGDDREYAPGVAEARSPVRWGGIEAAVPNASGGTYQFWGPAPR